jgi:hypothetical protein
VRSSGGYWLRAVIVSLIAAAAIWWQPQLEELVMFRRPLAHQ